MAPTSFQKPINMANPVWIGCCIRKGPQSSMASIMLWRQQFGEEFDNFSISWKELMVRKQKQQHLLQDGDGLGGRHLALQYWPSSLHRVWMAAVSRWNCCRQVLSRRCRVLMFSQYHLIQS